MKTNEDSLDFTGERLVTKVNEYWTLEHLHRYTIVKDFVKGKNVLDIACGEGYGSNLLAQYAKTVIGIDLSEQVILYAGKKYLKDNLSFMQGSATYIDLPEDSVDIVVSFETIEHLKEHDEMLIQIKKVLKEDGILIISSPDKKNYSDKTGYNNPFHVKELYLHEFENLIKKYFPNTLMLYQKSVVASIISSNSKNEISLKEFTGNFNATSNVNIPNEAMFNICIASSQSESVEQIKFDSFFSEKVMTDFYFNNIEEYFLLKRNYELVKHQINSNSYKVGRLITAPVRFLKGLIKTNK